MKSQNYSNPNIKSQFQFYLNPKYIDYKSTDEESGSSLYKHNFDMQLRLGFIKKVYGILSVQLFFTLLMCALSMTTSFGIFQRNNPGIKIFAMIISFIVMIIIMCYPEYGKRIPINYILLGVFTVAEGYIISDLCGVTNPKIVFMASSMTFFITIALTIYACTTKTDFTVCDSLLFIGSCIILLFGIFFFFTHSNTIHIIMCCLGVFIYSIYLIYDTQMLIGSKEKTLEYDDYIIGSLMLYLDIINIFMNLLELFKDFNKDN